MVLVKVTFLPRREDQAQAAFKHKQITLTNISGVKQSHGLGFTTTWQPIPPQKLPLLQYKQPLPLCFSTRRPLRRLHPASGLLASVQRSIQTHIRSTKTRGS